MTPDQTTAAEPVVAPVVTSTPSDVAAEAKPPTPSAPVVFDVKDLSVYYGAFRAIRDANLQIHRNEVTAFIGPSGCGKSTMLRCFDRMNDLIEGARVEGSIRYHGVDLYGEKIDPVEVRKRIGMVFQKPNPFPKSIYDNVAFGPKLAGIKGDLREIVERALRQAALWDEVKDRLKKSAIGLSGGQQQRLCIARAIAVAPEVILMDEPCSALDPIATARIEDLMQELKSAVHDRDRDPQHATGGPGQRPHRLLHHRGQRDQRHPDRRPGRVRRDRQDLLEPHRRAHGELCHRPVRLSAPGPSASATGPSWSSSASRSRSWVCGSTRTWSACARC